MSRVQKPKFDPGATPYSSHKLVGQVRFSRPGGTFDSTMRTTAKSKSRTTTTSEQLKLGQRIRFLRGRDTQKAASARIGISQKFLSELERGSKTASWETLLDIAHRGFGITIAALLFGIDDEADDELRRIDELLAGRSPQTRHALIKAFDRLLAVTRDAHPAAARSPATP
jgi:transcriptional regulator with XRE-family HTH domain